MFVESGRKTEGAGNGRGFGCWDVKRGPLLNSRQTKVYRLSLDDPRRELRDWVSSGAETVKEGLNKTKDEITGHDGKPGRTRITADINSEFIILCVLAGKMVQ